MDGEASSVSITLPSVLPIDENGNVSVAPSNVRIEGGMLRWDCVDENGVAFADSYTLDIEYLVEGSGMQKETVEVFTDSYTEFVTGRTYTVKVAANVKFSDGEKPFTHRIIPKHVTSNSSRPSTRRLPTT